MATPSKAQFLTDVQALLKKRYKVGPIVEKMSILEAVVYAICHEDSTREQANQALARFKGDFFDWNEVRVSSLEEIQGVLAGMTDVEGRAFRIRRFLRQMFEKTYGFNLDALTKKPQKDSIKALEEYDAMGSDFVLATVTRLALAGHAIPVDASCLRALLRLGVAEEATDIPTLRGLLERAVPKNRGAEFGELIEALAHDTCVEGEPDCPACELRKVCPTGLSHKAEPVASAAKAPVKGKSGKPK
ncbi:endonuclease III domain-containing protein [Tundrisphaera lichenicola]|uniref:endonuclease III domain-containing protein n=1 Tax=Tundrisphaera lichenicola TaxID=2029860 RepID=UPI003EBD4BA2